MPLKKNSLLIRKYVTRVNVGTKTKLVWKKRRKDTKPLIYFKGTKLDLFKLSSEEISKAFVEAGIKDFTVGGGKEV